MPKSISLKVGVKADPILYRYSYDWLFKLMAEEDVRYLQMGTFFELYQLPDAWFLDLKKRADDHGIVISSLFTAHRELGGFFYGEIGWEQVARKNFERYIEVGALLGAECVGSNPGAVLRDRMNTKDAGLRCYTENMKELMRLAYERGLKAVCIEPMSCLAEPPTLPDENESLGRELLEFHQHTPNTVFAGYCADIAHGYATQDEVVEYNHMALLESTLPYLWELHLKNTDSLFNSTFGFGESERAKGIVDIPAVRHMLEEKADVIPVNQVIGYLEIGGPKLGRDYSDHKLEQSLRESLQYCRATYENEN